MSKTPDKVYFTFTMTDLRWSPSPNDILIAANRPAINSPFSTSGLFRIDSPKGFMYNLFDTTSSGSFPDAVIEYVVLENMMNNDILWLDFTTYNTVTKQWKQTWLQKPNLTTVIMNDFLIQALANMDTSFFKDYYDVVDTNRLMTYTLQFKIISKTDPIPPPPEENDLDIREIYAQQVLDEGIAIISDSFKQDVNRARRELMQRNGGKQQRPEEIQEERHIPNLQQQHNQGDLQQLNEAIYKPKSGPRTSIQNPTPVDMHELSRSNDPFIPAKYQNTPLDSVSNTPVLISTELDRYKPSTALVPYVPPSQIIMPESIRIERLFQEYIHPYIGDIKLQQLLHAQTIGDDQLNELIKGDSKTAYAVRELYKYMRSHPELSYKSERLYTQVINENQSWWSWLNNFQPALITAGVAATIYYFKKMFQRMNYVPPLAVPAIDRPHRDNPNALNEMHNALNLIAQIPEVDVGDLQQAQNWLGALMLGQNIPGLNHQGSVRQDIANFIQSYSGALIQQPEVAMVGASAALAIYGAVTAYELTKLGISSQHDQKAYNDFATYEVLKALIDPELPRHYAIARNVLEYSEPLQLYDARQSITDQKNKEVEHIMKHLDQTSKIEQYIDRMAHELEAANDLKEYKLGLYRERAYIPENTLPQLVDKTGDSIPVQQNTGIWDYVSNFAQNISNKFTYHRYSVSDQSEGYLHRSLLGKRKRRDNQRKAPPYPAIPPEPLYDPQLQKYIDYGHQLRSQRPYPRLDDVNVEVPIDMQRWMNNMQVG